MTKVEEQLNEDIQSLKIKEHIDTNNISDGFHSFGELYEKIHILKEALQASEELRRRKVND